VTVSSTFREDYCISPLDGATGEPTLGSSAARFLAWPVRGQFSLPRKMRGKKLADDARIIGMSFSASKDETFRVQR